MTIPKGYIWIVFPIFCHYTSAYVDANPYKDINRESTFKTAHIPYQNENMCAVHNADQNGTWWWMHESRIVLFGYFGRPWLRCLVCCLPEHTRWSPIWGRGGGIPEWTSLTCPGAKACLQIPLHSVNL